MAEKLAQTDKDALLQAEEPLAGGEAAAVEREVSPAAPPEAGDEQVAAGEPAGGEDGETILTWLREEQARLQEELAAREATLAELQQRYLRLQADFDNYRKRTRREMEELTRTAGARLIAGLLPVVDDLERALAATGEADKKSLVTGIEMIRRRLLDILAAEGLEPVPALGQPFDPEVHEAVAREETADAVKTNLVVEEFRRGYTLHGKLLRPAMVKVAVAAAANIPQDAPEEENRG